MPHLQDNHIGRQYNLHKSYILNSFVSNNYIMATNKQTSVKPKLTQEQVITGFNQLRQEQRQIGSKIAELEGDITEHRLVLEALKEVNEDRKCFRMIGGVLVESTVKDVLPSLEKNKDMITQLIESLKTQIVNKGKEINEYMDKHNILIRQEPVLDSGPMSLSDKDSGPMSLSDKDSGPMSLSDKDSGPMSLSDKEKGNKNTPSASGDSKSQSITL